MVNPPEGSLSLEGVIYADRSVKISPINRGQVVEIKKREGDYVEAGEVIARLKYDKAEIARDRAQAAVALAEARLELATLDAAYYLKEFQKTEDLFKSKAASESELNQARLKRDEAEISKKITEADLATTKAELRYVEADLDETNVKSPVKGVITERLLDEGEIYEPGDRIIMFQILAIDTVKVFVNLPQEYLTKIKIGDKVRVKVALGGETLYDGDGAVSYIHPTIDASSETVLVKIAVPNPKHAIKVGLRGTVTFNVPAVPDKP